MRTQIIENETGYQDQLPHSRLLGRALQRSTLRTKPVHGLEGLRSFQGRALEHFSAELVGSYVQTQAKHLYVLASVKIEVSR